MIEIDKAYNYIMTCDIENIRFVESDIPVTHVTSHSYPALRMRGGI